MGLKSIKNWSSEIEKPIVNKWKASEMFKVSLKSKKKIYSIDTPPPYVNAPIHMGQAVTYCYMDFFARYKRMKGYDVLFPLGLDGNGLPIEMAIEKKFNISPFKEGRKKFIEACKKLLEETSMETSDTFAKLGISFTSYKEGNHLGSIYKTDSPEYRTVTQATFINLYKKGLIYEADYLTNWDPKLRTSIADSEIIREEKETFLNYVKFKLTDSDEYLVIATTRPELLCTAALIMYNPNDERYHSFKGKKAITPVFGIEVPILEHREADPDFGSGLVFMSKSAGDQDAVRFLREMGIKPVSAVGIDGRMNKHGKFLEGLKTKEAREKIIEEIKKKGLMEKQEKLTHSVPVSERSKAEIEFVSMPEFYLKQKEFIKDIKKISKEIKFFPPESKKILDDWLNTISIDWPISRRRFYATSIPLWHSKDKKLVAVPKSGKYYEPWKEKVPFDAEVMENGKVVGKIKDFKDVKWIGEERVLDTWMDSSISELVLLKYQSDKSFFKKSFPATLRPQGKEIVRTWLYYTLLRGYLETGKACFEDVWINQHILDSKGYKMSKSKGNVIDPQKLLKKYGAEAIRFWAATEGDLSQNDLKCSEERIRGELKTLNKLLNVSKFVIQFKKPKKSKLTELDKLFIDYLDYETKKYEFNYENYNFYKPAVKLRSFLWEEFASHYIELVKARAYNQNKKFSEIESDSAKFTLHSLLERVVVLLSPIIPQITSVIAKELKISLDKFPKIKTKKFQLYLINEIENFNRYVWEKKKDKGISLRDEISGIKIPKELKKFEKDLIVTHSLT